jgi:CRISPR-associated protein Csn2
MKIMFPILSTPITLSDEYVTTIVFENQKVLFRFVSELYQQVYKQDGTIVLSENDERMDIAKRVELITQFVPFDCNKKSMITKLQQKLRDAANESLYIETSEIISLIQNYLYKLTDLFSINMIVDDVDAGILIKAVNARFSAEYDTLCEALFEYCVNVIDLEGNKLFVFLNLRCMVTDEEFSIFSKTITDHKVYALFLENTDRKLVEVEKKTIVDNDLCVI